jgi:DNA repair photolyase
VIISASRRTDIPAYYSDWFFNRIKEGFVLVRNPMNIHQISRIKLTPDIVDGIVFWTKNPILMIDRLDELKDYKYYFQFTITPYAKDVEPNLPLKNDAIMSAFKKLSDIIGADRIIWRYDPILINERYSADYHIHAFEVIAKELYDYTRKVTISFIDENYRGVKSNLKELALLAFPSEVQIELASKLANIACNYKLKIDTCAEQIDLQQFGIEHARCIDDCLFAKLLGCHLKIDKDKTQRLECGCVTSIDIGMYNTCKNGCKYCYANYSRNTVDQNFAKHNPLSPLISGEIEKDDKINERKLTSYRDMQLRIL